MPETGFILSADYLFTENLGLKILFMTAGAEGENAEGETRYESTLSGGIALSYSLAFGE